MLLNRSPARRGAWTSSTRGISSPGSSLRCRVRSEGPSAWVMVVAALAGACILMAVLSLFEPGAVAYPAFAAFGLVLAVIAAAFASRAPRDRYAIFVALLGMALWTLALWFGWRVWRIVGGIYDHLFPDAVHARSWRILFQLISIPVIALMSELTLVGILVALNALSRWRRGRAAPSP